MSIDKTAYHVAAKICELLKREIKCLRTELSSTVHISVMVNHLTLPISFGFLTDQAGEALVMTLVKLKVLLNLFGSLCLGACCITSQPWVG